MPNPRDDMVIIPRLGKNLQATASTRAREERRMAGAKRKGGVISRLVKLRAARKAQSRMRRSSMVARRVPRGARAAVGGARTASMAARGSAMMSGAAIATGAIIAAIAAITVVGGSLITGETLEGAGAKVRKIILGDMDEKARAASDTRNRMLGSQALVFAAGIQGGVSKQAQTIFDDLARVRERELRGAEAFRIGLPGANTLDIMIQSLRKQIISAWHGSGGDKALDNLSWEWKMKYGGFTIDDVKGDLYPDPR